LLLSVTVYERLLGRHFSSLAAAVGLLIFLDEVVRQGFNSGQPIPYPDALRIKGDFSLFGTSISMNRLLVFLVAAAIAGLLAAFFKWTRGGMRMRAIAESPSGARICGVNTAQSIRTAFAVSGVAAAAAAVLIGLLQSSVSADLGGTLMVGGLAAALLGGGLSLGGAVLGAIIIGVAQSLAVGYVSSTFSQAVAYLIMIVILLLRPHGLFGRGREQRA
jgi:branched-chain amino acid transport system permease protein